MCDNIDRLCRLVSDIGHRVFNDQVPHDCFCSESFLDNPVIADEIVDFIEAAVLEKLNHMKSHGTRNFQTYEYDRVVDSLALLLVAGKKPWKIPIIKLSLST